MEAYRLPSGASFRLTGKCFPSYGNGGHTTAHSFPLLCVLHTLWIMSTARTLQHFDVAPFPNHSEESVITTLKTKY